MVLVETGEILGRRRDLHEIDAVPRSAQRHRGLAEEQIDVHRLVGLAGAAFLGLLDEPDDRGIRLRERRLVGEIGRGRRHDDERDNE